ELSWEVDAGLTASTRLPAPAALEARRDRTGRHLASGMRWWRPACLAAGPLMWGVAVLVRLGLSTATPGGGRPRLDSEQPRPPHQGARRLGRGVAPLAAHRPVVLGALLGRLFGPRPLPRLRRGT